MDGLINNSISCIVEVNISISFLKTVQYITPAVPEDYGEEEEDRSRRRKRKPAQYLWKIGCEEIIVLVTGNTKELPLLGRSYRTCYRKYGKSYCSCARVIVLSRRHRVEQEV